jgi:hypothetical protein
VLNFLAERYATTFPEQADWPTVMLPGYVKDMHYLRYVHVFYPSTPIKPTLSMSLTHIKPSRDTSGFEALAFMPLVRYSEVKRTERFLMDAWEADPLVPTRSDMLPAIYGMNESGSIYQDSTSVDWDAQYDFLMPVAQLMFDRYLPADFLVCTMYYMLLYYVLCIICFCIKPYVMLHLPIKTS